MNVEISCDVATCRHTSANRIHEVALDVRAPSDTYEYAAEPVLRAAMLRDRFKQYLAVARTRIEHTTKARFSPTRRRYAGYLCRKIRQSLEPHLRCASLFLKHFGVIFRTLAI